MESILLFGVFESVVLSLAVFLKKKKSIADLVLSVFFLLFGINIFLSYIEVYNRNNGYPLPFFINTTAPFILLHGPVLWLYVVLPAIA